MNHVRTAAPSLSLALLLALVFSAACGDDAETAGSGGSGSTSGSGGESPIEGRAAAIFVNEATEAVTVTYDGAGETAEIGPLGEVQVDDLDLRACSTDLDVAEGTWCASFDFGTVAGAFELPVVDGDVIVVVAPQGWNVAGSELEPPGVGEARLALLRGSNNPQVFGEWGYVDEEGALVAFDDFSPPTAIPAGALLGFESATEVLQTFDAPFASGEKFAGVFLAGDTESTFRLCGLTAAAPCAVYTADL